MVIAVDGDLDEPFGGDGRDADGRQRGHQLIAARADIDGDETGAFEQRVRRARHDESPAVDHHDVVAHLLHIVEEVCCHQHRDPERAEPGDEHQHLLAAERIETRGRLVEEHQFRVADQCLGELRALPHARGESADRPEPSLVEADEIEDVGCALARCPRRQAAELAERRHHVGGGLVEREAIVLGHVAETRPDLDRVGADVDPADLDRALGRFGDPEQQAEHRRLAGAVRADQTDEPARQRDREVVEGCHTRVLLGETFETEEGTGFHDSVESGTCTVETVVHDRLGGFQ